MVKFLNYFANYNAGTYKMRKQYIIFGFVIIIILMCSYCLSELQNGQAEQSPVRYMRPVPTVEVQARNRTEIRIFPGKVRASRRVKLAFSVSGLIMEINALEGYEVKKGAVLARLDPRDFQNTFDVAKARYVKAHLAFKRIDALRSKNIACDSEYEKIKAEYDIALAEFNMRKKALADTVLLAPFDGVVANRFVENYEHINAKEPILSFQDISVTEVVIQVPENIIMRGGGVENLKKIQVCFGSGNKCGFAASLRESCICSDSVTGTFDAVVVLKKRPKMKILPGMTAIVLVETSAYYGNINQSGSRIIIPPEAVFHESNGKSFVWIIPPAGGKVRKRSIETGSLRNEGIEVISGIKTGEHVATAGLHSLHEDVYARPMNRGKDGLDG